MPLLRRALHAGSLSQTASQAQPATLRPARLLNAAQVGEGPPPAVPDANAGALGALRGVLGRWAADPSGPQKLCFMLEHEYTEAGITAGLRALKGRDRPPALVGTGWALPGSGG